MIKLTVISLITRGVCAGRSWTGLASAVTCLVLVCTTGAEAIQYIPEWRPFNSAMRFALHGDYAIFEVAKASDSKQKGLLVLQHTLTFEPDIQLSSNFRIHARYRPVFNEAVLYDGKQGHTDRVQRAFFEARVIGLDLAGGRVPLEFHNFYMAQDDVLGGLIAKNNISLFGLPNIRILAFGTAGGRLHELEGRAGQQLGLYGVDAVIDTRKLIIEATFGYLHNDDFRNREERHAGLSMIRIQPRQSNSLRIFGNWNQLNRDPGMLLVMENSYIFPAQFLDRPTLYANLYYGSRDYRSMANGSLVSLGFLFNQLAGMPQLTNNGVDSYGFASGILLGRSRDFTVTPEIAAVFDQGRLNNDQLAGGIRTQMRLLDTSFLRIDLVALHQSIDANRTQYAASALVVYKF